jgi:hypothetical protein
MKTALYESFVQNSEIAYECVKVSFENINRMLQGMAYDRL